MKHRVQTLMMSLMIALVLLALGCTSAVQVTRLSEADELDLSGN